MFRRLFAIETAALQTRADETTLRQDMPSYPPGESLRDLSRFASTPSSYGIWSSRAAG